VKLRTNAFDLWVYHKQNAQPKYLLFHTSQKKADRWFHGGRFWQICGGFVDDNEELTAALLRILESVGLEPIGIWGSEHTYIYYNARRKNIEITPVFAAEVAEPKAIPLSWEHSECGWFTNEECLERIHFRGLIEGLKWTRHYISEVEAPPENLRFV